ncbi:MAG: portal protein [Legionella sp.]|uniref:portal protein n=1 Tax=Legionella sp. TaxID=459 RepID=UPI0028402101|nr:portal protein [Legionella sp.]
MFGFEIKRKVKSENENVSLEPRTQDDGALVVSAVGGAYGTAVDLDGSIRNEAELVTKYRDMSFNPECDAAIDEIVNELVCTDEQDIVKIILDNVKQPENVKKVLFEEFDEVLRLLQFNKKAYDITRKWYVDGRLYYHVVIDKDHLNEGILELRYIDPRKIRKVREVIKDKTRLNTGRGGDPLFEQTKVKNVYYIYNENGFVAGAAGSPVQHGTNVGVKVARDSIVHVTSGLTDNAGKLVLGYMHKAIKVLNELTTLEQAVIIYRLSRAPERRVWYVDVGNLPKLKAEQYMTELMTKHKNRVVYDSTTGTVVDDRKFTTMLEDYWLPRREGGRGTEVTTLPGGQTLGQLDDVLYFQKKFYGALNIPVARLESTNPFQLGADTEISRQEIKFSKFISRMRVNFGDLFMQVLERQLILKGLISWETWNEISPHIKFDFARDNYFAEMKDMNVLNQRYQLLAVIDPYQGKYVSAKWIRTNILKQTLEDMQQIDREIALEKNDEQFNMLLNQPPPPDDGTGIPGMAMDVEQQENPQQSFIGGDAKVRHKRGSNQYAVK